MKTIPRTTLVTLAAVAVLAACGGCRWQGPADWRDGHGAFPAAPDRLVEDFVRAYGGQDLAAYAALLHENFLFSYRACDAERLGAADDHHDRATELAIAERMFARRPVTNSRGQRVPAVTAIVFEAWERRGPWTAVADPGRPGLRRAVYEGRVRFVRPRAGDLVVAGLSIFYALPVARRDADGTVRTAWQLAGWVDRTGPACAGP